MKRMYLIVFLVFMFSACSRNSSKSADMTDTVSVSIIHPIMEKLDNDLNSFGTISYKTKNDVTSEVSGTVISFFVKEGDYVQENQLIAQLSNIQLEIQKEQYLSSLDSANASVEVATANLHESEMAVESRLLSLQKTDITIRQKELELEMERNNLAKKRDINKLGGITDTALEQLQLQVKSMEAELEILKKEKEISLLGLRDEDLLSAGYEISSDPNEKRQQLIELNTQTARSQLITAKAQYSQAEQQLRAVKRLLDELTIKAPSKGIIGGKYYENGEYIKENEKIVTLIDTENVYAVFYIQEQDMVNFQNGNSLSVSIPSLHFTYDSVIDEISPIADAQSGNFSVKSLIPNEKSVIKPGMFVKCSLKRDDQKKYLKIPESALVFDNGDKAKIYCVSNKHLVQKSIEKKDHKNGFVWIQSGITEKDVIVNNPSPFLREGQNVTTM